MSTLKSSARYAEALYELAAEQNNLAAIQANMEKLMQVNRENRDLELLLVSPIINSDKKTAILKEVFGDFEDLAQRFIALVVKNGREANLPEIAKSFVAIVKEKNGITPVTITSATKLDAAVKNDILNKIKPAVNGTPEITEVIDPSLIGGFVVRMGDIQIDASVASKLGQLKQRLTR